MVAVHTVQHDPIVMALARFERYYASLNAAIDDGDVDTISRLVDERGAAVEQLVAAYGDRPMPADAKARLKECEARLRARLVALYDELFQRLGDQHKRNHAVSRYARAK